MAEQLLEARLVDLGANLAFPPTPALAGAVAAQIAASPVATRRQRPSGWWTRRPAVVAASVLAALAVVVGGVTPVRTTVAHWLGIRGIVIETVPRNPTPRPQPTTTPTPTLGERLLLGRQLTLAEARAAVDFPITVPASLGDPDAVYLRDATPTKVISLVYLPRSGLPAASTTGVGMLVTQFRATVDQQLFEKLVGPDATVEPVTVNGGAGYFLAGQPHQLAYRDPAGNYFNDDLRLAGNTLIFERGDISIRIEANLTRDAALAIAQSLR
jgi:hypothetical protein